MDCLELLQQTMDMYSCPCLVVEYTEELISQTFLALGENQF